MSRNRPGRSRTVAVLVACVAVLPALLLSRAVAGAAWSTSGTGASTGGAYVLPTGAQPSGSATSTQVTLSWAPVTVPGGLDVGGYLVDRTNAATGAVSPAGPGCSGVVPTNHCVESPVPAGSWIYTDTPVQDSWSGPVSPGSTSITVP
jgi:hypothetical protein